MKKNRGMRRKLFTILMALMTLCFTQCKPTPEGGDDDAPKVRVSCEIPMCDDDKSDFTSLMTDGKIKWSNGKECVYVAIHGDKPQIIELESEAVNNPLKLKFTGEAAVGLIIPDEEYDIWYFGHSHQSGTPYFNLAKDGKTLTGSIANQSGRLNDLGYCHIAKTTVKATTENEEVKLNLSGVFDHQIAIMLLDMNNVTKLYGDAIVGTEYSLVYNGERYELDVEEDNSSKINVPSTSGISYVVLLPNADKKTNVKIKRGGKTYACTFHSSIEANNVYCNAPDGTIEALPWTEVENDGEEIFGEYVDLGLSVKWATCNIGTTIPEGYGDYFAWGETEPATNNNYIPSNCATYGLGYSELKSQGYIDEKGNLTARYDAATANWEGYWRMPTKNEINELLKNCTWMWTTQNGVIGYKVTGPNGNSIFLPLAGFYDERLVHVNNGERGYIWCSTPNESDSYSIYLYGNNEHGLYYKRVRYYGQSVRPVIK